MLLIEENKKIKKKNIKIIKTKNRKQKNKIH